MFLSSTSLTSSWLVSTTPAAMTPPLTIMRPTLSVSSTTPEISTSSLDFVYLTTTKLWAGKPPVEAMLQEANNPYYEGVDRGYTDRPTNELSAKCGLVWETSFYQWFTTAIDKGTMINKFSCFNGAIAPGAVFRQ